MLKEDRTQSDRAAELQKLEIAITYLNFRSRRIEAKEQELNEKRQSRDRMQELVAKIEDDPEQWERFDKNADSSPIPSSFEERPSEYRLKMLKERIDKQDTEVVKLEAEIMDLSRELADFETFVQKHLELKPYTIFDNHNSFEYTLGRKSWFAPTLFQKKDFLPITI